MGNQTVTNKESQSLSTNDPSPNTLSTLWYQILK